MADYDYTSRRYYHVTRYIKNYGNNCATTYQAAIDASNADATDAPSLAAIPCGQQYTYQVANQRYAIDRCLCQYNLAGLSPGDVVAAHLLSAGGWVTNEDGVYVYAYDGTSVPATVAGYGVIGGLATIIGQALLNQQPYNTNRKWSLYFNEAGIDFLKAKAGGTAKIAFKVSTEGSAPGSCPGSTEGRELGFFLGNHTDHKLIIGASVGGYTWVEGDYLAYLDFFRTKRLELGSVVSGSGDSGYPWVEGNYICYMDSSGNKRRILGSLTGLSGKLPSQISINYVQGGTKFCYIDSSGNERAFEGAIP